MDHKNHNRRLIWGLVSVFVLACLLGYGGFRLASLGGDRLLVQPNGEGVGGSFRVVSLGGSTVTEGDFRGSWLLVWFVDPRCPKEQCQPPLQRLDAALHTLASDPGGERIAILPLVLSLDTSQKAEIDDLSDYVTKVAPHILPFYATPNMVRAMTGLFQAPYEKMVRPDGGIYYRAAPSFVLMTPTGHYAGKIPAGGSSGEIVQSIRHFTKHPAGVEN